MRGVPGHSRDVRAGPDSLLYLRQLAGIALRNRAKRTQRRVPCTVTASHTERRPGP